ncbi:hypothetical protein [Oceanobacillus sp. FSL W7-1304]
MDEFAKGRKLVFANRVWKNKVFYSRIAFSNEQEVDIFEVKRNN